MSVERLLNDDAFEAAENSTGSGSNPFATESQVMALAPQNALVSGGATWNSNLTFDVTALTYWLNGMLYASAATQVTLSAADPTDPRIDIIVVDAAGFVSVIAGTPSPSPVKPELDLSTYVEVTFVTVDAGATTPTLMVEDIYLENAGGPAEWNTGVVGGTIIPGSNNDPYAGGLSIEGTNCITGNRIDFLKVGGYTINLTSVVELKIKLKNAIGNNERFRLRFRNGGTNLGVNVDIRNGRYGFDSSNTSDYQSIAIPMSVFQVSGLVTELRVTCNNIAATVGFFMDNVRIQEGFGVSTGTVTALDVIYNPATPGDWSSVPANVQDALDFLITNSSTPLWSPTALTLGDWFANGASFLLNAGVGGYYDFDNNVDDEIIANIGLSRNEDIYDGSDIQLELEYMKFGAGGGTIIWELDYAFIDLNDDAYSKIDGTLQIVVDASLLNNQELYTATFPAISGNVGARQVQFTVRRNGTGPGSDTYTGQAEIYGTNLTRV